MPDRPLRVLFLLEDLCFGGTQKQNLELALRLDTSTFSPHLLTLTGPTDMDARASSLPLNHMGATCGTAPLFFLRLGRQIKKIRPDILVCCTALPNIWGRIWGRIMHVPVIVGSCRGGGAPMRQHEWLLWRLAHGIVCNSWQLVSAMQRRGVPPAILRYIANGVDTDHFRPSARHACRQNIVCVARLAADKDHKTLLEAFALLAPKFPAARLTLVGEGPEGEDLRRFAASFPSTVANRIIFAGPCADAAPYLESADVFALTSIREGQPNVILEAMACGLPVCATSVGGIPALVRDNGFLTPSRDATAFAKSLESILANPERAATMGATGRARCVEDFSFASMVKNHEKFFLELWQKYGSINK